MIMQFIFSKRVEEGQEKKLLGYTLTEPLLPEGPVNKLTWVRWAS